MRLTDLSIRALKPPLMGQRDYFDDTFKGFGIRVSCGGAKAWFLVYRSGGTKRRATLARFPDVGLARARQMAHERLGKVAEERAQHSLRFRDALPIYHTTHLRTLRTAKEQTRILDKYWRPLHELYLNQITPAHITKVLDELADTPIMARSACAALSAFINWASPRQWCDPFPKHLLTGATPSRDRVLAPCELKAVWHAATSHPYGTIVRLLILTGQRRGEIALLKPEYIYGDWITWPKEAVKNDTEHAIPLTPMARALFPRPHGPYLLALSNKPFSDWGHAKAHLDKISSVSHWRLHDLRRTFSTIHAQIGTPPHVTERLLNHINGGALSPIARIYNRYVYRDEMTIAMTRYEERLHNLLVLDAPSTTF